MLTAAILLGIYALALLVCWKMFSDEVSVGALLIMPFWLPFIAVIAGIFTFWEFFFGSPYD